MNSLRFKARLWAVFWLHTAQACSSAVRFGCWTCSNRPQRWRGWQARLCGTYDCFRTARARALDVLKRMFYRQKDQIRAMNSIELKASHNSNTMEKKRAEATEVRVWIRRAPGPPGGMPIGPPLLQRCLPWVRNHKATGLQVERSGFFGVPCQGR